jgi:hypothetical protein
MAYFMEIPINMDDLGVLSGYLTWPWEPWPIYFDGLPIKNGDFPWQAVNNQRVNLFNAFLFQIWIH